MRIMLYAPSCSDHHDHRCLAMNGGGIITIIAVSYKQRDYSSSGRMKTIASANRFDYYSVNFGH
jgi:hypothetical protein